MSQPEAKVADPAPAIQYVPIVYDPARRKRRARRAKEGVVGTKPYIIGPRGGVAWVGPSALRYDPVPVLLEPARRRRRARRADPIRIGKIGTKGIVDAAIDGLGWAWIAGKVPLNVSLGPLSGQDLVAIVGSAAYEYAYMKRGALGALIGAAVAYAVRRWMP